MEKFEKWLLDSDYPGYFLIALCSIMALFIANHKPKENEYIVDVTFIDGSAKRYTTKDNQVPRVEDSGCVYLNKSYVCGVREITVKQLNHGTTN